MSRRRMLRSHSSSEVIQQVRLCSRALPFQLSRKVSHLLPNCCPRPTTHFRLMLLTQVRISSRPQTRPGPETNQWWTGPTQQPRLTTVGNAGEGLTYLRGSAPVWLGQQQAHISPAVAQIRETTGPPEYITDPALLRPELKAHRLLHTAGQQSEQLDSRKPLATPFRRSRLSNQDSEDSGMQRSFSSVSG